MAALTTQISILFSALLSTIIECLQLPPVQYTILAAAVHRVSITVRSISGSVDGVYIGGPSATDEIAFEQASQMAVNNLKEMYDIYIRDVTAFRKQISERCTNLWRLKRQQLEQVVKGLPKIDAPEEFELPEISHLHMVSIDFVQLLTSIQKKIPAHCSDMEVVEHTSTAFTAWLSITHDNNTYAHTYMCSDTSLTYQSAEQDLAAKAITYLAPIYSIEVIDANHCADKVDMNALICKTLEKKCMLLREKAQPSNRNAPTQVFNVSITKPTTPAKLPMRGQQFKRTSVSRIKTAHTPEATQAKESGIPDSA